MKSFDKYIRDDNDNDPTNFAIRNKTREGTDYKLVPKKCWDIVYKKYGGLELKRIKCTDYYAKKYEVKFPSVSSVL